MQHLWNARGLVQLAAPVCRFYDKAHKLDVLDFFKAQAVHPDAVPVAVFRCIGRTVWADIGEHLPPRQ